MEQGERQNGPDGFISAGRQSPTIELESVDADGDIQFQMHVRSSVRSLQRDLENLPNMPEQPTIIVNHIYNIHHASDRPSEQHMQDVIAYGEEYAKHINRRCLDICKMPKKLGPELPQEPTFVATPSLKVVGYFSGKTGIPRSSKYIPDPKYQKNLCRECPEGKQIDLKSLHQYISYGCRGEECQHAALVGNIGCGKTVLSKRYANMVLNREIPELSNVEAVHYISVDEIPNCVNGEFPIRELLFDRFFCSYIEPNARKYGFEYFCQNPERMLFIFDGADDLCCEFQDRVEPISYTSATTLRNFLQNIFMGNIFSGCRTLVTTRDWALKDLIGTYRPQKFVLVGPLATVQRIALIRSVGLTERMANDFCSNLSRKFHASFHLTKDPLFLYFAISSLQQAAQCQDIVDITSDVMLVLNMLQCLTRSQNSRSEFGDCIETFKVIAFNMIKNGFVGVTYRDLQKYCCPKNVHGNMKDFMIVAPEHQHPICHRLLNNDYSYFFPSQVFQEVLAALYVGEISLNDFVEFVDNRLHTERWLVVRRFVCGMLLHRDIKHNARHYMRVDDNMVEREDKLITSLEEQAKKIETLSSYEKFELLASLHECGEVVKPLIEKHIRNLVLPDIALEPSDLFVLSQIERFIHSLCEINVCFDKSISAEEYSQFMSAFVKKGEKIRLDLSRLGLDRGHVTGLIEPVASIINTRHQHKREICLVVKKGTPVFLIREFEKIQNSFPELCTIKVDEIVVAESNAATE